MGWSDGWLDGAKIDFLALVELQVVIVVAPPGRFPGRGERRQVEVVVVDSSIPAVEAGEWRTRRGAVVVLECYGARCCT